MGMTDLIKRESVWAKDNGLPFSPCNWEVLMEKLLGLEENHIPCLELDAESQIPEDKISSSKFSKGCHATQAIRSVHMIVVRTSASPVDHAHQEWFSNEPRAWRIDLKEFCINKIGFCMYKNNIPQHTLHKESCLSKRIACRWDWRTPYWWCSPRRPPCSTTCCSSHLRIGTWSGKTFSNNQGDSSWSFWFLAWRLSLGPWRTWPSCWGTSSGSYSSKAGRWPSHCYLSERSC